MPTTNLLWLSEADDDLRAEIHAVVHDVVAAGGAVGYHEPPTYDRISTWLDTVLKQVRDGDAAFTAATVDGVVRAVGLWRRGSTAVFQHRAEVQQIMAHPSARGLGLGKRVMEGLVANAREQGIEIVMLGVRGNNHGAIELYESLGFRECGRMPNAIAVGTERWDDVWMYLPLGYPEGTTLNGDKAGGLGSSPRRT
ncbi:GNAT family N-acetyltransferase [Lentzea flaviverrucosa]|uniref:L-amino acid N-acyltransferase YncA n=1 Tax=Lentzea flaviverrucosa TaxID=200379 RepID=A0A1H9XPL5_9PSEU|nr:N-acetyltransferase [Lentzea flaviverrucosa]RDI19709.1 L-amino acid N-acyltransferase YncA [Lentzea flaviverrucosa]SES47959.1 L-amino acid N-acyltransferase YncA [Lentzea flaviverrucosa]